MRDFLKIINKHKPFDFVTFDHNPEKLMVKRNLRGDGKTTPAAITTEGNGLENRGANPSKLTFTNARIVGPETKRYCDVLLSWLNAEKGILNPNVLEMPVLIAQWGPPAAGFYMEAKMSSLSISYQRVSMVGIPLVALVTMTLKEEPETLTLTNPTSGGRPGRRRHTVSSDDSLASIATGAFGDPNAWRAIAKVNQLDDPGRLRPGDTLYLPAPDELKQLAESAP